MGRSISTAGGTQTRFLGANGPAVFPIGLGCMGMSGYYGFARGRGSVAGMPSRRAAVDLIRYALDAGVNLLDTADVYGPFVNEEVVGEAIRGRRDGVVLATKFGFETTESGVRLNGTPDYVRAACDHSLSRLSVETIDVLYLHRVDPQVPVEETVGAMGALVDAGKARHLGLSEVGPETIRRAHAVRPIAAVQSEFSLWSREPETRIFPTLRELGIAFVPYAPLGRGLFARALTSLDELVPNDFRRSLPRFQGGNLGRNLELARRLGLVAEELGTTSARVALAWVLARGEDVVPIVGTTKREHLDDDLGAAALALGDAELAAVDKAVPVEDVVGARYANMSDID